jgi:predicted dehydrogenase
MGNLNFELGRPWLNIEYRDTQETRLFDADHRGIMAMVLEFRRSILEKSEPSMTGEEGLSDLELVLKAYESAETGLPVDLNGD